MTITPHILVGAALATKTDIPAVAFLLGFVSHFILDAIPHLDAGTIFNPYGRKDIKWPKWTYLVVIIDFAVSGLFLFFLKDRPDFRLMIYGASGAVIVDIIENFPSEFVKSLPVFKQIQWLHHKVHYWLPTNKWYWGALTSILIIGGSLWFLLKF